jgi:uncharacterized membrane protein
LRGVIADIFSVVFVVAAGPVVGVILFEHFIVLALVRRMEPSRGVAALQSVAARAWKLGPLFGASAMTSGVLVLAAWPWRGFPTAAAFTVAGVAVFAGAVIVTFAAYYPVDAEFRSLTVDSAPAAGPPTLERLARRNVLRVSLYACGLVLFAAGVVRNY